MRHIWLSVRTFALLGLICRLGRWQQLANAGVDVPNLELVEEEALSYLSKESDDFDAMYSIFGAVWFTEPRHLPRDRESTAARWKTRLLPLNPWRAGAFHTTVGSSAANMVRCACRIRISRDRGDDRGLP
jgi:hypothetical protein